MSIYNLVSFGGLFVLMGVAWLLSANRRVLNVRVIGAGVGLQLAAALLVFTAPGSRRVFLWLNDVVLDLLGAATAGQRFLFGPLAVPPGQVSEQGEKSLGFVLAIQGLPIIIFFGALMGLLYYWRVMPALIRAFAWVFNRLMRVSGAESLCAASNIFVGIESATTIRPYLSRMTRSEFCTVLTAGMATVASTVMGLYVLFLNDVFPTIAGHLISASILSAPAAIVMSKILVPEDGEPVTLGRRIELHAERESGAIEAIVNGAMAGVRLIVGVCALLVAFLGLVALIDLILGGLGAWVAPDFGWSLKNLLGYAMAPFACVMGVPWHDALSVGSLLGERLVATEVPAYLRLAAELEAGSLDPRSAMIAAYALCGFAHVASLAIFVGGIAALVPERRADLAAVGPRALAAATFACLMTGCVAGVFFHEGSLVLQAAATQ